MTRCPCYWLPLCAALAAAALPAQAQPSTPQGVSAPTLVGRNFPAHTHYGQLVLGPLPDARLNGQTVRTAPGFRLFNADNHLILGHTVQGQPLRVAYLMEASTGWLWTAWILRDDESAPVTH